MTRPPASAPKRAGRQAGFSLLETVVAVAVIALVSLVMLETARFVAKGYDRGLDASRAGRDAAALQAALEALIAAVQPIQMEAADGDRAALFDGSPDRMAFVAPYEALRGARPPALSALGARPGLGAMAIEIGPGGGLVLSHAPFGLRGTDGRPPRLEPERAVLSPGATGLALRYYDRDPQQRAEPGWREDWRRRPDPPAAVALSLEGGAQAGGPIVLRTRLSAAMDDF